MPNNLPPIHLPPNPTPEQLDAAYAQGLLRKEQLEDGAYYSGDCRNAQMARWHAAAQVFVHWRSKFGHRYLECIKHPVDEPRYDVFLAEAKAEPGDQAIPDDEFERAAKG